METLFDTPQTKRRVQSDTAHEVFGQFLDKYQLLLVRAEKYLEDIIETTDSAYKAAYIPWKKALHELITGAHLVAKKIPLTNKEKFIDALCMFRFEGAVTFLRDICNICQAKLKVGWRREFQEQIDKLLFAISALNRQSVREQTR